MRSRRWRSPTKFWRWDCCASRRSRTRTAMFRWGNTRQPSCRGLVADDERMSVRLMQVNLERAGYQVVMAGDGAEALRQLREQPVDVAVVDAIMPRMDGFALLEAISQDSA